MIGDGGGVAATLQRLALGMRRATEEFTITAMHAQAILPHSLLTQFPADSGWRVMSSEQAVLPSPSNHFRRQPPPCSINLLSQYLGVRRSADDGRVTISGRDRSEGTPSCLPPFCFMPPQDIPVLPRLPLLGAAFRLGGRYRRDPRFSWGRLGSSAGIIMRHEGERQRGERFKIPLSYARASKAAPFFLFIHCSPPSFVEIGR